MALTDGTSTVGGTAATGGGGFLGGFPIFGAIGALSGALGGLFGRQKLPSAQDLQRLFGPAALSGDIQKLYDYLSKSQGFQSQLTQNNLNAQNFQNNLAANLGARGLTTTGVGAIANAAGQSAYATGEQALRGGLFNQAGDLAQQNLLARLQAYQSFQQQQATMPTGLQSLFGGIANAGGLAQLFK